MEGVNDMHAADILDRYEEIEDEIKKKMILGFEARKQLISDVLHEISNRRGLVDTNYLERFLLLFDPEEVKESVGPLRFLPYVDETLGSSNIFFKFMTIGKTLHPLSFPEEILKLASNDLFKIDNIEKKVMETELFCSYLEHQFTIDIIETNNEIQCNHLVYPNSNLVQYQISDRIQTFIENLNHLYPDKKWTFIDPKKHINILKNCIQKRRFISSEKWNV